MEHSLINPNQIRATGIKLCDDPTDPYRDLGIEVEGITIPFHMEGSICSFKSRTPTDWELKNCRHIELTSDAEWEPDGLHFGLHSESLLDAPITISAYKTRHRRSDISPEVLARQWGIGLATARQTLQVTTQAGIRHALHPLTRRYRTDTMAL